MGTNVSRDPVTSTYRVQEKSPFYRYIMTTYCLRYAVTIHEGGSEESFVHCYIYIIITASGYPTLDYSRQVFNFM